MKATWDSISCYWKQLAGMWWNSCSDLSYLIFLHTKSQSYISTYCLPQYQHNVCSKTSSPGLACDSPNWQFEEKQCAEAVLSEAADNQRLSTVQIDTVPEVEPTSGNKSA